MGKIQNERTKWGEQKVSIQDGLTGGESEARLGSEVQRKKVQNYGKETRRFDQADYGQKFLGQKEVHVRRREGGRLAPVFKFIYVGENGKIANPRGDELTNLPGNGLRGERVERDAKE